MGKFDASQPKWMGRKMFTVGIVLVFFSSIAVVLAFLTIVAFSSSSDQGKLVDRILTFWLLGAFVAELAVNIAMVVVGARLRRDDADGPVGAAMMVSRIRLGLSVALVVPAGLVAYVIVSRGSPTAYLPIAVVLHSVPLLVAAGLGCWVSVLVRRRCSAA